jgi:hypothetical protein
MVDTLSLEGKVAIITGSGRETGIGAATAIALARNGASVTINYVSDATVPRADKVLQAIREAGGKAIAVRADVTKPEEAKKLVEETLKGFNTDKVDILSESIPAPKTMLGAIVETTPHDPTPFPPDLADTCGNKSKSQQCRRGLRRTEVDGGDTGRDRCDICDLGPWADPADAGYRATYAPFRSYHQYLVRGV